MSWDVPGRLREKPDWKGTSSAKQVTSVGLSLRLDLT